MSKYKYTIIIWVDKYSEVSFFLVAGDCSHLDRVYIGSTGNLAETELRSLLFDDNGNSKLQRLQEFPILYCPRDEYCVITAGIY